MKHVYIHIPFCKNICSYCDFCKMYHLPKFTENYFEALRKEVEDSYMDELISTIYIGGGTPSCLTNEELDKLFNIVSIFKKSTDCEFTFECNPEDITEELITYLIKNGINRLSIGVESFNKENLEFMERKMDYKDLEEKLNMIRAKGINNINLDLIYALPNESLDTLKKDVKKLLKLNPEHISTYSLIIEEDTKLKLNNTSYIDEELDAKMYDYICSKLKKNYTHYEVSNFAKEGFESKHNMAYWLNEEYYGFGLGASGYINGFRYENTHNLNDYLEGEYHKEESLLSNEEIMEYEVILGLRMLKGINLQTFFDKYGVNIQDVFPVKPLLKSKELIYKDGHLFINPNKIYVMNEILLKLV